MKPAEVLVELALHAGERPEDAPTLERFRELLQDTPAPFSRAQYRPGHLTCSACVLSPGGARVLLLRHAALGRWLQPGGHLEPADAAPLAAALRELREESGLTDALPLARPGGSALVDLDIHSIPARGAEPAHLHYDLRFAFAARGNAALARSEESTALRWVDVARLGELSSELSITRLVARTVARLARTRAAK